MTTAYNKLVERVAEEIRANLIPSVAEGIPWAKMKAGRDGYRRAAAAIIQTHNMFPVKPPIASPQQP